MGELGTQPEIERQLLDDDVNQMLVLAERLKAANGGVIDDAVIQAVSEATSAPPEYVRLAARMMGRQNKSSLAQARSAVLEIEPDTRRHVVSALCAAVAGAMLVASQIGSGSAAGDFYSTIMLVMIGLGLWNLAMARDSKLALVSGALFGGMFFFSESLFAAVFRSPNSIPAPFMIMFLLFGMGIGASLQAIVGKFRVRLGIEDPASERQELLRQLVSLQDKLKSGAQDVTILSVDVVGSTRIKADADPLAVEFTFNEYHQFVEQATTRFGGSVHSTAGDGLTLAFEFAHQAFACAKFLQTGLIELNTFKNKVGTPIVLRCGIHSGSVVTPKAGDIKSLNFAHVIDLAAHIQKVCPPGGIAISEGAAANVPGGAAGIGSETAEVMETTAVIWMPRGSLGMALPQ